MLGLIIKTLQDIGAPKSEKDLRKYLKITDAFKSEVMDNTWNKVTVPNPKASSNPRANKNS
jgi:hypothetical protein